MKRLLLALVLCVGCKGTPEQTPTKEVSASSSAAVAAAPSASAAPKAAWYEGNWQGTYKAELLRLETAAGGVKQWKEDDGSKASGEGKLSLQAGPDGNVSGTASGPLGEHNVSGKIEGEHVSLALAPAQADGFRGFILAKRAATGIEGALQASTGDSLTARRATVTLARAEK